MKKGNVDEIPLILFTLLTQLAIGCFWISGIIYFWASLYSNAEAVHQMITPAFVGVIPVMAAALLISLLHLGTPLNAWRAAANLRSSWLSREIVFTLLFAVLEAAFAWTHWLKMGQGWLQLLLALSTALAGGLALFSMSRLYMLRTISSWNTWMTPTITSTLLLGSLAVGVLLALNPEAHGNLLRLPLIWIGLLALFLLSARAVVSALTGAGGKPALFVVQISLIAFALSVSSMLTYQCVVFELSGRNNALSWLTILAFLAALAEEAVGAFCSIFHLRGLESKHSSLRGGVLPPKQSPHGHWRLLRFARSDTSWDRCHLYHPLPCIYMDHLTSFEPLDIYLV
jgi:DMSO reductase anchor subunit